MATKATVSAPVLETDLHEAVTGVTDPVGFRFEAGIEASQAMLSGTMRLNQALFGAARDQMRRSLACGLELAFCGGPRTALAIQADHARTTLLATIDEAARIRAIGLEMLEACRAPLCDHGTRAAQSAPVTTPAPASKKTPPAPAPEAAA